MKDSDFTRINPNKLASIPTRGGTFRLIKNHWWIVDQNGKALRYKSGSYQCNSNPDINRSLIHSDNHPGCAQVFIENAWIEE